MRKPYFEDESVTIYHGDCRELLSEMPRVDLVLTDPPYGMNWIAPKYTNGQRGHGPPSSKNWGGAIVGDDTPFDPSPWLNFPRVILWGANHYAQKLPRGTTLVFIKRFDDGFCRGFLSDAEIGWMSKGMGVYCFRDTSIYSSPQLRSHPNQKPIGLMKWCISFARDAKTVLDPYMGSGTTLRAAKDLGLHAIGIEIEERYCEIAAKRMAQEALQFEPQPQPQQMSMTG